MKQNHSHINWPAFFIWIIYPATLYIGLAFLLLCLLSSCATQKETHRSRVITADTLATELQADTHVSDNRQYIDSLVTAMFQRHISETTQSEQEQETVNETITTTRDSLGREQRTEQRTINRTASRQQQQREEQLQQQYQAQLIAYQEQMDSMFHSLERKMESHYSDSSRQDKNVKMTASEPRFWRNAKTIAFIFLIGIVFYLTRHIWKPLLIKMKMTIKNKLDKNTAVKNT